MTGIEWFRLFFYSNGMKRISLFFSVLLFCSSLMAQRNVETIYLTNGSVIKGEIVEQIPNQSIKIRLKDGSIFVYQMSDVQRIAKEEVRDDWKNSGHKGLDFNVDLGYYAATKGGGGTFAPEVGFGKRFNKNFYWGVGSGLFIPTGDGDLQIPVTSDFKMYFPLASTSIVPMGVVRLGYIFNTADDVTVGSGKKKTTVEAPNFIMLQLMPGIQLPLSSAVDFNLAIGYTHFIPTGGGDGSGAFTVKAGFGFHNALSKTNKPIVPTRDNGIQFTIEGASVAPWNIGRSDDKYSSYGGMLAVTYKMNPNISLGLGYGFECTSINLDDGGHTEEAMPTHNMFLRGQYRLNDNRFSPIASCDLGIRKFKPNYSEDDWGGKLEFGTNFFVAPAIGFSLRTTNNSYLECKVGYTISPKLSADFKPWKEEGISISGPVSAPFIKLGFTHTFGLGSGWVK